MKKYTVPLLVIIACMIMGTVDAVIQPGYAVKSVVKVVLFLLTPVLYCTLIKNNDIKKFIKIIKKGFSVAVLIGVIIYIVILLGYFIFKDIFDFSMLTTNLEKSTGVNKGNFLWVSIYISFVNSFLEEFFFRGFSFLTMRKFFSIEFCYIFSSLAFALYHVAMMIGWFGVPVVFIVLIGLFIGGIIFDKFDEKNENIYLSWLVHMFANFSINTIGFILFAG